MCRDPAPRLGRNQPRVLWRTLTQRCSGRLGSKGGLCARRAEYSISARVQLSYPFACSSRSGSWLHHLVVAAIFILGQWINTVELIALALVLAAASGGDHDDDLLLDEVVVSATRVPTMVGDSPLRI